MKDYARQEKSHWLHKQRRQDNIEQAIALSSAVALFLLLIWL